MKKTFTLFIKKILPMVVFMVAQLRVWAIDTTTTNTLDKAPSVFAQPWIWIALATIIIIKLIGPVSYNSRDYVIIRKKQPKKT